MKITKAQAKTIVIMAEDAIRDREEFISCYAPKWGEPDQDAKKIIADTRRQITRYRKLGVEVINFLRMNSKGTP